MDDIQILLYIIFILFAIISRALKKKKEAPKKHTSSTAQQPSQSQPPRKQLTFEELLKEFTEGHAPVQQEYEEEEEEFNVNNDEEIQRIYQESVRASKEFENSKKKEDNRHTGNFTHFEGYSEEDTEEEVSEFAKLLQDEESAKKAIILSEILNKKY